MLNSYNVQGRLTAKPELRTTSSDKKVVSFKLAVDRNGKDAGTDFIPVVAWDKTAEFIAKHFDKGQQMLAECRLQSRDVSDKNADKPQTVLDVVINQVYFCGYKAGTSRAEDSSCMEEFEDEE